MLLRVPVLAGIRNSLSKNLRRVSDTIGGHAAHAPPFYYRALTVSPRMSAIRRHTRPWPPIPKCEL